MIRSRLSYANVMATIAVFLALGGGAYAASLKRNSVGPKQLKPNAVTGPDANESTFDQVPNAANAANAANANLLDSLDSTDFLRGRYRVDTTEDVTPSVAGVSSLRFDYSANTVVTDLDDGRAGQFVALSTENANVDILDGNANFALSANWLPAGSDDTLMLVFDQGYWIELSRSVN